MIAHECALSSVVEKMTPFELHINLRVGVFNSSISKVSLGIPCVICDNIGLNGVTVCSSPFWSPIMTLAVETARQLDSWVRVLHFSHCASKLPCNL